LYSKRVNEKEKGGLAGVNRNRNQLWQKRLKPPESASPGVEMPINELTQRRLRGYRAFFAADQ